MDNATRSERTRDAVIKAALTIISRDGPGRLTLDAIARESGISKGGLTHQFRTKEAVLKALLQHQIEYFENFSSNYLSQVASSTAEPELKTQIATFQETVKQPHSVALAILGAMVDEPGLLSAIRDRDLEALQLIRAEATDPDLATLRWVASRGLTFAKMLGLCPFSDEERERLFGRLLDTQQWGPQAQTQPDMPTKSKRRVNTKPV